MLSERGQAEGRGERRREDARLLAALLKDGKPVSSREIHDAMAKAGASDSMIGRAKRELGDVSVTGMKGRATGARATTGRGRWLTALTSPPEGCIGRC
jgi:hypothetical protein